jgi:hypothetical protein
MLKLYAPNSLMGKNETVVYREGFGIWRCHLRQV